MFYELRRYKVLEGKMDEWVAYMEDVIIPFQVGKGMVITGSFRGEEDDTTYVWMRRFASEAEREELYEKVYQSETWEKEIAPQVGELLDRSGIDVTRIVPTPRSVGALAQRDGTSEEERILPSLQTAPGGRARLRRATGPGGEGILPSHAPQAPQEPLPCGNASCPSPSRP